jgi:hypothetical protein
MAEEYLKHGWSVLGTVRGESRTKLHDLAAKHDTRVQIETLEINDFAIQATCQAINLL